MATGASSIEIREEAPSLRPVQGVETGIPGFVGVTERGPVGLATVLTSFTEYVRLFGYDTANGDVSHAVRGFFEEGGQRCYVVRTVHYSNIANASSKTSAPGTLDINTAAVAASAGSVLGTNIGPFDLEPGDTLVISIDGGGNQTATFTATAPQRDSGTGTFSLSNGQTLTLQINGGGTQTVTFLTANFVSISAATAAEVAAVINASIVGGYAQVVSNTVRIKTDRRGTGATLNITGGTANGALGYTTGSLAGTGNVADIDAVTVAEVETVVEAAVTGSVVTNDGGAVRISSNTTGGSSSVLVVASSTADDELGLDNATHTGSSGAAAPTINIDAEDGAYSSGISIKILDASSGVSSEFDLQVIEDGLVVASFPNLTMDSTADRYIETIFNNESTGLPRGLTATDLELTGSVSVRRPANGTLGPLSGGSDGLTSLADTDFIGSSVSQVGMYALDVGNAAEISLLAIPGRATSAVHNAMITYCEVWRKKAVFAVFDPPANQTASQMKTYVESTASLFNSSEFAAIYWPRVKVLNPDKSVFGNDEQIVVPPSGIICGVMARVDGSREGGVYEPPAGVEVGIMRSVLGFETDEVLDERKRDIVYPSLINPLTTQRGQPRYIDGTKTLKANFNFPTIAERRGVIFIEQSIKKSLEFARHRNNNETLRRQVDRTVYNFLVLQTRLGAFRSDDPDEAFWIDFDVEGKTINDVAMQFQGILNGRVGLATNKPTDDVILTFSQDTRAFDAAQAE
jgi:uncharacterized protein